MKLINLSLRNFKGVRKFDLAPGGQPITVYGDNATGKTSIVDAFLWLLFGKDSSNRADFQVKTVNEDGQVKHKLDHSVEAVLQVDGQDLTLKRVLREKWAKPRGKATKEFAGHETVYEIDGVPVKKMDYDARIKEIAPEDVFRLLTEPMFFNTQLHWEKRRATLIDVAGDVTDEDVIAGNDELERVPAILDGKTIDERKAALEATRRRIGKEIEELPVRIDEVHEGMPEVTGSQKDAEAALASLQERRQELSQQIADARAGSGAATVRSQLADIRASRVELETNLKAGALGAAQQERQRANALATQADNLERDLRRHRDEESDIQARIKRLNAERDALRKRYATERQATWSPPETEENTCPHCGQALPAEKVEEARESARAAFNRDKAERLEEIQRKGKGIAAEVEKLESRRLDLVDVIREKSIEAERARDAADEQQRKADAAERNVPDPSDDQAYQALLAEEQKLQAQLADADSAASGVLASLTNEYNIVSDQISDAEQGLAAYRQIDRDKARIKELEARETELAQEYERIEEDLHLLDLFIRAKAEMLTERINAKFNLAQFRLFEEQINGGLKPTCVTTFKGVSFDDLNHGSKLNVGLDIINTLARYHGFTPPVFIDNAESVTSILPTAGQAIRLVVSASDKTLRVEESKEVAA